MTAPDSEHRTASNADFLSEDTWASEEGDNATVAEKCRSCGAAIPTGALVCPECGEPFDRCAGSCSSCGARVCVGTKRSRGR